METDVLCLQIHQPPFFKKVLSRQLQTTEAKEKNYVPSLPRLAKTAAEDLKRSDYGRTCWQSSKLPLSNQSVS